MHNESWPAAAAELQYEHDHVDWMRCTAAATAARQNAMKRVHVARHPAEAHLIRGMLEAGGVHAEVRGDQLYGAFGELPVLPTVWIMDETLAERADALVVDFLRGAAAQRYRHERWTCTRCGEILEGQFTTCWQCGETRPQPV